MTDSSLLYWLWLSSAVTMRQRSRAALLDAYGSPELIYKAGVDAFSKVPGVYQKDAQLLGSKTLQDAEKILLACDNKGIAVICPEDEAYPERLKQIYSPPAVLYVKGKLPDIDALPVVSVIGTRKASPYGIKMGKKLAYEIGKCGGTVVSLLTAGVDAAVAEGALLSGGKCIAVLGTAIDTPAGKFEKDIIAGGAVISEYPPETAQIRYFFRERNRIASAISLSVVVVEAPEKSGTKYFVNEAVEQGKDIFAVPGNADSLNSEGTLNLLKLGAKPVASGWDVLSEYKAAYPEILHESDESPAVLKPVKEKPASKRQTERHIDKAETVNYIDWTEKLKGLSDSQQAIVLSIRDGAASADEIIAATGLSAPAVLAQLTILEIKGLVGKDPARHIILK